LSDIKFMSVNFKVKLREWKTDGEFKAQSFSRLGFPQTISKQKTN